MKDAIPQIFFWVKDIADWLNANLAPTLLEWHEAIQAHQF